MAGQVRRKALHFYRLGKTAVLPVQMFVYDREPVSDMLLQQVLVVLKERLLPDVLTSRREHDLLFGCQELNQQPRCFAADGLRLAYHFVPTDSPVYSVLVSSSSEQRYRPKNVTAWTLVLQFFGPASPLWPAVEAGGAAAPSISKFLVAVKPAQLLSDVTDSPPPAPTAKRTTRAAKKKPLAPLPKKSRVQAATGGQDIVALLSPSRSRAASTIDVDDEGEAQQQSA